MNIKFSFSNKEDQSDKLEYFKNKLANFPHKYNNKTNKQPNNNIEENNINDLFKKINFENFDSIEIESIIKDNNISSKKIDTNVKYNTKSPNKGNYDNLILRYLSINIFENLFKIN